MKRIISVLVSLFIFCTGYAYDIYEVTASKLNVRVAPSTSATVIGKVHKGDKVEVLEYNPGGWVQIMFKTRKGYVSSKFLRLVKTTNIFEDENITVDEPVKEFGEENQSPISSKEKQYVGNNDNMTTLINGPFKICNNFELYYGLSAGVGYSTFMWNDGSVNGRLSYTIDLYSELYFNNKVSFIPKNYFVELQLGFDGKGATWYPMNYFHSRIYPFGYKFQLNPIQLIGKAGLYLGIPLNDLESYNNSNYWSSDFQVGLSTAVGIEYKQYSILANFEYCFSEVASSPAKLNNINIYGSLVYKFGKLTH